MDPPSLPRVERWLGRPPPPSTTSPLTPKWLPLKVRTLSPASRQVFQVAPLSGSWLKDRPNGTECLSGGIFARSAPEALDPVLPPSFRVQREPASPRTAPAHHLPEGSTTTTRFRRVCFYALVNNPPPPQKVPLSSHCALDNVFDPPPPVALLCVDPTQSSETGTIRGLCWHTLPRERVCGEGTRW